MKNFTLFLLFFLVLSTISHCQTYISTFYGFGSSYLNPSYKFGAFGLLGLRDYNPYYYRLLHDNVRDFSTPVYFYKNHLYGLKLNQKIGHRFELDLESSFSITKQIPMVTGDIVDGVTPFGFNKYNFLITLKFYPFKYLYISLGPGIEKIKMNPKYSIGVYWTLKYFNAIAQTQLNYNLAVGGIYRNFFCELKFIDGFTYIEGNDLLFYPISSFYGVIGYRLKIYPIRHKKNVDCPKF